MRLGSCLIVLLIPYVYATIVVTDPYADLDYGTLNVYSYIEEEENYDDNVYSNDDPVDSYDSEPSVPYTPLIFYPFVDTGEDATYY